MARARVIQAFSAGGVVFRRSLGAIASSSPALAAPEGQVASMNPLDGVEIALVGRTHSDMWVIPKGTPHRAESVAEAALREVREETGLITRIVAELGSIHYTFTREGTRFHKEVFHYLMEAVGGDVSLHDDEYDEARWFSFGAALDRLTFDNEVDMLRRAHPLIARAVAGELVGEQQLSREGAPSGEGRGAE